MVPPRSERRRTVAADTMEFEYAAPGQRAPGEAMSWRNNGGKSAYRCSWLLLQGYTLAPHGLVERLLNQHLHCTRILLIVKSPRCLAAPGVLRATDSVSSVMRYRPLGLSVLLAALRI